LDGILGPFCVELVLLKMSEKENKKVKPNSDSDSCAGANAASGVDMTLATTDPLSEIVWSPEKGLSLKCADKNSSLFRDVGPSYCMVLSPPQSVIYCNSITDKPINDNFLKSTAMACVKPDYKADEKSSTGKGNTFLCNQHMQLRSINFL
jgi:hypothetical protein